MPDSNSYYRQSWPGEHRAFKNWRRHPLPRTPAELDRLADQELAVGRFAAADRLSWMAHGLRAEPQ